MSGAGLSRSVHAWPSSEVLRKTSSVLMSSAKATKRPAPQAVVTRRRRLPAGTALVCSVQVMASGEVRITGVAVVGVGLRIPTATYSPPPQVRSNSDPVDGP